jgi:hypothetical protein
VFDICDELRCIRCMSMLFVGWPSAPTFTFTFKEGLPRPLAAPLVLLPIVPTPIR